VPGALPNEAPRGVSGGVPGGLGGLGGEAPAVVFGEITASSTAPPPWPDRDRPAAPPELSVAAPGPIVFAGRDLVVRRAPWGWAADVGSGRYRFPVHAPIAGDEPMRVEVLHGPGEDPGFAAVLGQGAILSAVASLSGRVGLHATTVMVPAGPSRGEVGIAVMGPSGQGKSATAAMLVAAGCTLVADDVSVLDPGSSRVRPGLLELRLRQDTAGLARIIDAAAAAVRSTPDGRIALRPALAPPEGGVEVTHCVLPSVGDDPTASPSARRLQGAAAMDALIRSARLVGWREPTVLAREFDAFGELADAVPVIELRLPRCDLSETSPPSGPDGSRRALEELAARVLAVVLDA
jgi:hypothetical protein